MKEHAVKLGHPHARAHACRPPSCLTVCRASAPSVHRYGTQELEAKAAAIPEAYGDPAAAAASPGPAAALVRAFSRRSRQRRTAAGRLRARQQATAAAASGWAADGGAGYGGGGGGAIAGNQVAPAPGPGPGAMMPAGFVAPVVFSIPGQGQGVVPTQPAAARGGGGMPRQDPNLVLSFN